MSWRACLSAGAFPAPACFVGVCGLCGERGVPTAKPQLRQTFPSVRACDVSSSCACPLCMRWGAAPLVVFAAPGPVSLLCDGWCTPCPLVSRSKPLACVSSLGVHVCRFACVRGRAPRPFAIYCLYTICNRLTITPFACFLHFTWRQTRGVYLLMVLRQLSEFVHRVVLST